MAVQIGAVVAVVVVPFGYAITGLHRDVLMGFGCALAVGVGVGLRGGSPGGRWTGILVGSIVGIITALLAGELPWDGFGVLVAPVLGLSVGLIDGLGGSTLSGYRDIGRETLIVSILLALGLLPVSLRLWGLAAVLAPLLYVPWIVLIAGLLSHCREGWLDARPPRLLVISAVFLQALFAFLLLIEVLQQNPGIPATVLARPIAWLLAILLVGPVAAFIVGRAATTWLTPRLRMYARLADDLSVVWVPIGGFASGCLTIIVLFAGFYGMLERFQPGAFSNAGTGVIDWLWFAFFNALAQDYAALAPVSVAARALVGAHLILSVGWALVLFAAVMSSIQPRLERIARRDADEGGD